LGNKHSLKDEIEEKIIIKKKIELLEGEIKKKIQLPKDLKKKN
jgi:hypothetical protein